SRQPEPDAGVAVLADRALGEAAGRDDRLATIYDIRAGADRRLEHVSGRLDPAEEDLLKRSGVALYVVELPFDIEVLGGLDHTDLRVGHIRNGLPEKVRSRYEIGVEYDTISAPRYAERVNQIPGLLEPA